MSSRICTYQIAYGRVAVIFQDHVIFSTIIDHSFAAYKVIVFSLKVCRLNIKEVRESEVLGHWGGNSCVLVLGFCPLPPTRNYHHPLTLPTQFLQTMNSLPIGLSIVESTDL